MKRKTKKPLTLDQISQRMTYYIGTSESLVIHTLIFGGIFLLKFFRVPTEEILLILTTLLSIEAVYLAIFIQMTVNRTTESLAGVEEDIDDIQEDVDSLERTDVVKVLRDMESRLKDLQKDITTLQKHKV